MICLVGLPYFLVIINLWQNYAWVGQGYHIAVGFCFFCSTELALDEFSFVFALPNFLFVFFCLGAIRRLASDIDALCFRLRAQYGIKNISLQMIAPPIKNAWALDVVIVNIIFIVAAVKNRILLFSHLVQTQKCCYSRQGLHWSEYGSDINVSAHRIMQKRIKTMRLVESDPIKLSTDLFRSFSPQRPARKIENDEHQPRKKFNPEFERKHYRKGKSGFKIAVVPPKDPAKDIFNYIMTDSLFRDCHSYKRRGRVLRLQKFTSLLTISPGATFASMCVELDQNPGILRYKNRIENVFIQLGINCVLNFM